MSNLKIFFLLWLPAIILMAVIFAFSSIPSKEMPSFGIVDSIIKKGGHALGYGLLALTYLRGLQWGKSAHKKITQTMWMAWLLAVTYSATDEFHQSFVPGRHPAVTDVMIDAVGAACALLLARRLLFNKNDQPEELVTDN